MSAVRQKMTNCKYAVSENSVGRHPNRGSRRHQRPPKCTTAPARPSPKAMPAAAAPSTAGQVVVGSAARRDIVVGGRGVGGSAVLSLMISKIMKMMIF